jgi:hypothetical protein
MSGHHSIGEENMEQRRKGRPVTGVPAPEVEPTRGEEDAPPEELNEPRGPVLPDWSVFLQTATDSDVRVLDHFVVGEDVVTSFAERGLL